MRLDQTSGEVRLLQGQLASGAGPQAAEQTASRFFVEYADLFGLASPATELVLRSQQRDAQGHTALRYSQRYAGVRVLDGDLRAQVDGRGALQTVHGRILPQPQPQSLVPRVDSQAAIVVAQTETGAPGHVESPPELVIARRNAVDHLAYAIILATAAPARWFVLVDALDGQIVERRNMLRAAMDRRVSLADSLASLPGTLARAEGQPPVSDAVVNAVYDSAGAVYDYYRGAFARDSLDGAGMPLQVSVLQGAHYPNAYWNGSRAIFGDGDDRRTGPFGLGLDVVAHELTHGISEPIFGISYADEPGALDEAYSDIFAALIDGANWEIGEKVVLGGGALRSLADPTRYGQPGVWGEYITTADDNGGVHLNSGIFAHAAFLIAARIGRDKLAQIAYRTLTAKLTSASSFTDVALLSAESCQDLQGQHGITPGDCRVVQQAFADTGLDDPPPAPPDVRPRVYLPLLQAGDCAGNLLRNAGFEDGQEGWPNTGGLVDMWAERPGEQSARLGGSARLLQLVQLPSGARELTLSLDVFADPNASAGPGAMILLEDPATRLPVTDPQTVGAGLTSGRWQHVTMRWSLSEAHPALRLVLRHSTSQGPMTVDNLDLRATCGGS